MSMQPGSGRAKADVWIRCVAKDEDSSNRRNMMQSRKRIQLLSHSTSSKRSLATIKEEPGHEEVKEEDHHEIREEGPNATNRRRSGRSCSRFNSWRRKVQVPTPSETCGVTRLAEPAEVQMIVDPSVAAIEAEAERVATIDSSD